MTPIALGHRRPRIFGGPTLFVLCQFNQLCEARVSPIEMLWVIINVELSREWLSDNAKQSLGLTEMRAGGGVNGWGIRKSIKVLAFSVVVWNLLLDFVCLRQSGWIAYFCERLFVYFLAHKK